MFELTTQSVLFPELISKPVLAAFDQAHSSADGGGLLLKAVDERLGLSTKLADCLRDARESGKVQHELVEMLQQRQVRAGRAETADRLGPMTQLDVHAQIPVVRRAVTDR